MKILVIGGTRFIGLRTVMRLHGMGHDVTVFHRGSTEPALPGGVRHIHCPPQTMLGDRRCFGDFVDAFDELGPDVVLDMIAVTEQDGLILMDTFRDRCSRAVVISSQDVYRAYGILCGREEGPLERLPLTEDAPLRNTLYPYRGDRMRSDDDPRRWMDHYEKILVERSVMSDGRLPCTVLRLPMVYGPGDPQHRMYEYVKRMDDRRPQIVLEEALARWRWTRGFVDDVAAGIVLAVTDARAAGTIYNIGEACALSLSDWIRAIGRAAEWRGSILTVPRDEMPAHLRTAMNPAQDLVTDSTRIRAHLGFKEAACEHEAVARTVRWERAHPPDKADPSLFDYAAEDRLLDRLLTR